VKARDLWSAPAVADLDEEEIAPQSLHVDSAPLHWKMTRFGDLIETGALDACNGYAQGEFNEYGQGVPHLRPFNVS